MEREYVLLWFNHRNECTKSSRATQFEFLDLEFIRRYIKYYKDQDISNDTIARSIMRKDPMSMLYHIDFMMNKLAKDFSIQYEVEENYISKYF